ncbi:MAG: GIY-YIG nuclease family protein [Eggerthellaceae bacterium]
MDAAERVRAHNAGAGAKYTRSRLPVRLLAQAAYATKHEAMSAEYRFAPHAPSERTARAPYAREPFEQVLSDLMPAAVCAKHGRC